VSSKEEIVEQPVGQIGSAGSDDLSPSAARSVAALLRRRPLSWRELMDDSALMTSAFVGAAAAVIGVRVLRRR